MTTLTIALGARQADRTMQAVLAEAGHACVQFDTTIALLYGLRRQHFDGMVIDIDCADIHWLTFLERRRSWLNPSMFVVLAGPPAPGAAAALDAGADDFVTKPLLPGELLARLGSVTRRRLRAPQVDRGGCVVDPLTSSLVGAGAGVALTARELAVAQLVFENAGEVVSRRRLANDIWGCDETSAAHSIEQHMYQLRRKLRRCVGDALKLRGIYGTGYRLDVVAPTRAQ